MIAKKKPTEGAAQPILIGLPRVGRGGRWFFAAVMTVGLAGGASYAVWRQVREHVLASGEYQVDPNNITITPPAPWIHSEIKAEVIRDASFDGPLSILENELTVRMATAFSAHPWVAHVERVSKRYPSGLDIVLSYRKPVAMVEVQQDGALPVDIEGVVLPTGDFSPAEAEQYPRIGEILTTPAGPVGVRWGDACVTGGAQIAAALANDWNALKLFRIVPAGRKSGGRGGVEYAFALYTHTGTRIEWGRAPSTDLPGELPAVEKIARLKRYAAEHGSLDGPDGPQQLVLLDSGEIVSQRRGAIKPLPKTD
ncbi:MAG: hypothetical protein HY288_09075 [Planctomycetia bacterium]|nr:hypothetical protein [Planctomycetia bacterium]